jgi:hypothetical protein
MNYNGPKPIGQ